MASLVIQVTDALRAAAKDAEIDLSDVCSRAIEDELSRAHLREQVPEDLVLVAERVRATGGDDNNRYQHGFELGTNWARETATYGEMWQISEWNNRRWRQFAVRPEDNSLAVVYCAANELPAPQAGVDFWFEQDSYTNGVVAGVAEIYSLVHGLL